MKKFNFGPKKWLGMTGLAAVLALGACSSGGGATSGAAGSDASLGDQVKHKIIGIDPGAGIMTATQKAIDDYGLDDWTLVEGSSAAMNAALDKAIKKEDPIIVTGWTPHWMFSKYDLKYLEDPKKSYGEAEEIHTIARQGLKEDHPEAYQFLSNFQWTEDEMGEIMIAIQDGTAPEQAAADFAEAHPERVAEWTDGIKPVSGDTITLAYVAWDSEIASFSLVQNVMQEKLGFKVNGMQVEAGPMWLGVAQSDADASLAAWLPLTHADYWAKYQDKVEDLGANMTGVKTGLVVPSYVEATSIEDLTK
ncbi:glycine betaine ABC transporter substrate-binding protein [Saccharibacillus sp. CPCC 101409]|uniref:glycine betaine ABC transporter substrate-binding protein n=1 Tax=Saccharibacillus sp. CPCC 101409 TaxID=3058041 RepID=UPI0026732890|nr:glycine betaine ABC transporter substrate-binding protein [Saccharibacillus sp. CPCC 101409]MDO3408606.1 glycine betaine ABC transporter substrate-binding protein [Saccharibacillus sp. CPCC 101409]